MLKIRAQQMDRMAGEMKVEAVMDCPQSWVSFELLDEDRAPLAGVAYRISVPG